MNNNLNNNFITLNEVIENIQRLWIDMTYEEREECVHSFFGIRNKNEMLWFIQKYIPVRH